MGRLSDLFIWQTTMFRRDMIQKRAHPHNDLHFGKLLAEACGHAQGTAASCDLGKIEWNAHWHQAAHCTFAVALVAPTCQHATYHCLKEGSPSCDRLSVVLALSGQLSLSLPLLFLKLCKLHFHLMRQPV